MRIPAFQLGLELLPKAQAWLHFIARDGDWRPSFAGMASSCTVVACHHDTLVMRVFVTVLVRVVS